MGRVWIATADGIDVYDGYSFKRLRHDSKDPNSLSVNYTRSMILDSDGDIWIGTLGGGLNHYDSSTERVTRYNSEFPGTDVFALFQDRKGLIWIGTDKGVSFFDKQTVKFKHIQHDGKAPSSLISGSIRAITQDTEGRLWFGSSNSGVCRFNQTLKHCQRFQHNSEDPTSLAHNAINFISIDSSEHVWIGTEGGGLDRLDSPSSTVFDHFHKNDGSPNPINDNDVTSMIEDKQGLLWFGTWEGGLNRYNPENNIFDAHQHSQANPSTISGNSVISLYIDHSEQLWVGTYNSGVNWLAVDGSTFLHYRHDPLSENSISNNTIWSIAEDQDHDIWIGTSRGLNKLDPVNNSISELDLSSLVPGLEGRANVKAILPDREWYWLGLYKLGLVKLNPASREVLVWKHEENPQSLGDNTVRLLLKDSKGMLWIGTQNGLNRLNTHTNEMRYYPPLPDTKNQIPHRRIRSLYEDKTGHIWIGTSAGVSRYRPDTDDFENFSSQTGHLSKNGDDVRAIYQNDDGTYWLASSDGLNLVDFKTGLMEVLREAEGLANNTLYSLIEDNTGSLWATSNNGLSRFNPQKKSFTNYSITDGLQSNEFNFNAHLKASDGTLYIGGVAGVNHFDPQKLINNTVQPKGTLSVSLTDDEGNTSTIKTNSAIDLNNNFGRIQFDFSALHFQNPDKNRYRYRLLGYDTEWFTANADHHKIGYTSLDAGNYQFEVFFIGSNSISSDKPITFAFSVNKSPWKTYKAYGLYLLLNLLLLSMIYLFIQRQRQNLNKRVKEQTTEITDQKLELEHLSHHKEEFYRSMAHELRTPMSLIQTSLELVSASLEKEDNEKIDLSLRAVSRLNTLTDQILLYSRNETENWQSIQSRDISEFFIPTLQLFSQQADLKDISFNYDVTTSTSISLDWAAVQDIIYNLTSNAIKYTQSGGSVQVTIGHRSNYLLLTVKDTGIGISEQEQTKVLAPYYRAENTTDDEHDGYGLGLSIVQDRLNACHGEIKITSETNIGTNIHIRIPEHTIGSSPPTSGQSIDRQIVDDRIQLLIIEDDTDLQQALYYIFKDEYSVHLASNKKEAMYKAYSLTPDIILSDVMLPDGNGFEILQSIRQDIRTSHIPFIIITALSDEQSRNSGLLLEANDYIAKPFTLSDLKLRVQNQLLHRKRIQTWLANEYTTDNEAPENIRLNTQDKKLMNTIRVFLMDNISNARFKINNLADHVHIEGRTLERKMNALVGKSPKAYFIDMRLEHASKLLLKGLSVKTAAAEVGYKSSASFSRKFKAKFGITPSEFQKKG